MTKTQPTSPCITQFDAQPANADSLFPDPFGPVMKPNSELVQRGENFLFLVLDCKARFPGFQHSSSPSYFACARYLIQ